MLFTSLPTIKSGNIPLILLATQAKDNTHPYAWPGFYPDKTNPPLPCIVSADLKAETSARSIDLWLPTPSTPHAKQPHRRVFVAWTVSVGIPPSQYSPNDPNYDLMDLDVGWTGAVNGPRFQVRTVSSPSRPTGQLTKFSSPTIRATYLGGLTTGEVVHSGGVVTELAGIAAPGEKIGEDTLCYLRVLLPYRTQHWAPASVIFYVRGIAVDQW